MAWFDKQPQDSQQSQGGSSSRGIDFETAAARVTAESPAAAAPAEAAAETDGDALIIKPEWAIAAVKGCFYPAARFIHPAYAVSDEESQKVSPQMQVFLQDVADKYAPAAIARLANRYPAFWDLVAVLGVLYYEKWRAVSKLIAEEERAAENAKRVQGERVTEMPLRSEPEERVVGDRLADGSLVI